MEDRWMRLKQVLGVVPVSKSTWWQWVKDGKAPKPTKLGERVTVWKASDVYAFVERRV